MIRSMRIVFATFPLILLSVITVFGQSPCKALQNELIRFEYPAAYSRAKSVLPEPTRSIKKAAVYIQLVTEEKLYIHTNLIDRETNETTLKVTNLVQVANVHNELLEMLVSSQGGLSESSTSVLSDMPIYVDTKFFEPKGKPRKTFGGLAMVRFVYEGRKKPMKARVFKDYSGQEFWEAQWAEGLYFSPDSQPEPLIRRLRRTPFVRKKTKVVVALENSQTKRFVEGTEEYKGRHKRLRRQLVDVDAKTLSSLKVWDGIFQQSKGQTLIVVTHVEGDSCIIRVTGKDGQPVNRNELHALARKHDVDLLVFGCHSGLTGRTGFVEEPAPINVLKRLDKAFTASNWWQFFEKYPSEKLRLLVQKEAVSGLATFDRKAGGMIVDILPLVGLGLSQVLIEFIFDDNKAGGKHKNIAHSES